MRRDIIYLGALVAVAASIVQFGIVSMLAVIGPAWALRRGPLRPANRQTVLTATKDPRASGTEKRRWPSDLHRGRPQREQQQLLTAALELAFHV